MSRLTSDDTAIVATATLHEDMGTSLGAILSCPDAWTIHGTHLREGLRVLPNDITPGPALQNVPLQSSAQNKVDLPDRRLPYPAIRGQACQTNPAVLKLWKKEAGLPTQKCVFARPKPDTMTTRRYSAHARALAVEAMYR